MRPTSDEIVPWRASRAFFPQAGLIRPFNATVHERCGGGNVRMHGRHVLGSMRTGTCRAMRLAAAVMDQAEGEVTTSQTLLKTWPFTAQT